MYEGQRLLNIEFPSALIDSIIEESYYNVHLVQETCYRIRQLSKVWNTQTEPYEIPKRIDKVEDIVKAIIGQYNSKYHSFITLLMSLDSD